MSNRISFQNIFLVMAWLIFGLTSPLCNVVSAENCVRIELFIRNDSAQSKAAFRFMKKLQDRWPGLVIESRDVLTDKVGLSRAHQLIKQYQIQKPGLPIIHAARQLIVGFGDEETTGKQVENLLTIHAYTRDGCPHCAAGKIFLAKMEKKYPGFRLKISEITRDPGALNEMYAVTRQHKILASSVPLFHFCGQVIVGYDTDQTTGTRIEKLLKESCVLCTPNSKFTGLSLAASARWLAQTSPIQISQTENDSRHPSVDPDKPIEDFSLEEVPLTELPPAEGEETSVETAPVDEQPKSIELPLIGVLNVQNTGLPLFTVAVGLVDGFNPCAMWVLLFLLSILVNLKSRGKILAVAGTFVLISGVAYFAFMAAWLNVFLFIGYLRPAQIMLGALAIFVGSIHVKDFLRRAEVCPFRYPSLPNRAFILA